MNQMAVAEASRTTVVALSVRGLSIDYRDEIGGINRAVDGVSIDVPKGSILGIVLGGPRIARPTSEEVHDHLRTGPAGR